MLTRPILLSMTLALLVSGCATIGPPVTKQCIHENEGSETDIGYCRAVRVGNTLYVSGTAAAGDMPSAIRTVYTRLQKTLGNNGLSFADVVREVVYATDLDAFIRNKETRKEFYGRDLPAATWVQIQRLYTPSYVVEVELTAIDRKHNP